jgi:hypothetical protein
MQKVATFIIKSLTTNNVENDRATCDVEKIKWRGLLKIIWRRERHAGTGRRLRAAGPPSDQNGISRAFRRYPRQPR